MFFIVVIVQVNMQLVIVYVLTTASVIVHACYWTKFVMFNIAFIVGATIIISHQISDVCGGQSWKGRLHNEPPVRSRDKPLSWGQGPLSPWSWRSFINNNESAAFACSLVIIEISFLRVHLKFPGCLTTVTQLFLQQTGYMLQASEEILKIESWIHWK